ncbi:MAG: hypothetical protein HQK65_19330 [Desulfamplus sp.]|nr:hypothetical protein [Desulfamplus sp.]
MGRCIFFRRHYKRLFQTSQRELEINPDAGKAVCDALTNELGPDMVKRANQTKGSGNPDFPVSHDKGRGKSVWASNLSKILNSIPPVSIDSIFVHRSKEIEARKFLREKQDSIIEENL